MDSRNSDTEIDSDNQPIEIAEESTTSKAPETTEATLDVSINTDCGRQVGVVFFNFHTPTPLVWILISRWPF